MKNLQVFSGNANMKLALDITAELNKRTMWGGAPPREFVLGDCTIKRFADSEIHVEVHDDVRANDVYVVQPTCGNVDQGMSPNDSLMELLVVVDALRRASAGTITAVIPYYGYGRADRKVAPRTPITARLVADMIAASGVNRVVCVDLHAAQIMGFFDARAVLSDHIYATPALLPELEPWRGDVVVSPDAGGVARARAYAKHLGGTLAIIDKRRERANESEVMNIIGEVEGRRCLIIDDMIDTAGTLVNAARALIKAGARNVAAAATHAVLSGPAVQRIRESPLVEVIVTDTVPLSEAARAEARITVASIGPLLAEVIHHIHVGTSVSKLFV